MGTCPRIHRAIDIPRVGFRRSRQGSGSESHGRGSRARAFVEPEGFTENPGLPKAEEQHRRNRTSPGPAQRIRPLSTGDIGSNVRD